MVQPAVHLMRNGQSVCTSVADAEAVHGPEMALIVITILRNMACVPAFAKTMALTPDAVQVCAHVSGATDSRMQVVALQCLCLIAPYVECNGTKYAAAVAGKPRSAPAFTQARMQSLLRAHYALRTSEMLPTVVSAVMSVNPDVFELGCEALQSLTAQPSNAALFRHIQPPVLRRLVHLLRPCGTTAEVRRSEYLRQNMDTYSTPTDTSVLIFDSTKGQLPRHWNDDEDDEGAAAVSRNSERSRVVEQSMYHPERYRIAPASPAAANGEAAGGAAVPIPCYDGALMEADMAEESVAEGGTDTGEAQSELVPRRSVWGRLQRASVNYDVSASAVDASPNTGAEGDVPDSAVRLRDAAVTLVAVLCQQSPELKEAFGSDPRVVRRLLQLIGTEVGHEDAPSHGLAALRKLAELPHITAILRGHYADVIAAAASGEELPQLLAAELAAQVFSSDKLAD